MPYLHSAERWLQATRTLNTSQECMYWRMVTWSAINGELVPLEFEECCRICRAKLVGERKAVADVLEQFYDYTHHGYVQRTRHQCMGSANDDPQQRATLDLANTRKQRSRRRGLVMVRELRARGVHVLVHTSNEVLMKLCRAHAIAIPESGGEDDSDVPESGQVWMEAQEEKPRVTQGVTPEGVTVGVTENVDGVTLGVTGVTVDVTPRARGDRYLYSFNTNTEIQNTEEARPSCEPRARSDATAPVTPTGAAGLAMKAAGLPGINTSHPKLLALLDAGVTPMELQLAATEAVAKGKGFAYALAMVEGRRRDAEASGPVPGPSPPRMTEAEARARQWAPLLFKDTP